MYGIASSTEVAYYTYIYAKVDKETYKKVTSHTYTAILLGNFIAAVLSQLLVSTELMNYKELTYLTLGSVTIALGIACFLPSVKQSIYFHRQKEILPIENEGSHNQKLESEGSKRTFIEKVRLAYGNLWQDCKRAYSETYVLKWSVWWAISSACYIQVNFNNYNFYY